MISDAKMYQFVGEDVFKTSCGLLSHFQIDENSPRISTGASGLGSKLSCCVKPPDRKTRIVDFAVAAAGSDETTSAACNAAT